METIFNQTSNFPVNTKDLRCIEASLFQRLKKHLCFVKSNHSLALDNDPGLCPQWKNKREQCGKYLLTSPPTRNDDQQSKKTRRRLLDAATQWNRKHGRTAWLVTHRAIEAGWQPAACTVAVRLVARSCARQTSGTETSLTAVSHRATSVCVLFLKEALRLLKMLRARGISLGSLDGAVMSLSLVSARTGEKTNIKGGKCPSHNILDSTSKSTWFSTLAALAFVWTEQKPGAETTSTAWKKRASSNCKSGWKPFCVQWAFCHNRELRMSSRGWGESQQQ